MKIAASRDGTHIAYDELGGGPPIVLVGGKSPDWMRNAMRALADVLPNARHSTLEGQTHIVKPEALAPVLIEFFDD